MPFVCQWCFQPDFHEYVIWCSCSVSPQGGSVFVQAQFVFTTFMLGTKGHFIQAAQVVNVLNKHPLWVETVHNTDHLLLFLPVAQQTLISVQWKSFGDDAVCSHESCSLSVMFVMVWMSLVLKCWRFSASHILEQSHLVFRGDVQHFIYKYTPFFIRFT